MKGGPPPLLPILRSRIQGDLLAHLYLHPEEAYSLTELAQLIGSSVPGVHTEVNRLVAAGYLRDRRVGQVRQISAATDTVVYEPLTQLLLVTFGPKPVLVDALRSVAGVREAYIYGSWAGRYSGVGGPIPHDVDVLVIGDADADHLDAMASRVQADLRRPVNVTRLRVAAWHDPDAQPFVRALRGGPLVRLTDDREQGDR